MYEVLWGKMNWNAVSKDTISMDASQIIEKANDALKKSEEFKIQIPGSIKKRLKDLTNKKRKDRDMKDEPNAKFLNTLTKPYSDLNPEYRLELYESDCMIKRKLILTTQWQRMDTLWFQQNRGSHP
jgi:hypothetical protein